MGAAVWHLGRVPRFMTKASLFKVPVFGWMLRKSGQIPVDRDRCGLALDRARQPDQLRRAELIESEGGVIVYPEGTLTRDPDLWPMRGKSGAVRLALESGIPLIPAAHWGTQELMPRYGKSIRPFPRKTIEVAIGEPIGHERVRGQAHRPKAHQRGDNEAHERDHRPPRGAPRREGPGRALGSGKAPAE